MAKQKYSFVDPIFGRERQPRFPISKIFIYGKWYCETWEEKDRGEYWISFSCISGEAIELVFPTFESRNKAIDNIIPDRPLEEPIHNMHIERISNNYVDPITPEITTRAKVGIVTAVGVLGTVAALVGTWFLKYKKPAK